jgi:hypothetical protein
MIKTRNYWLRKWTKYKTEEAKYNLEIIRSDIIYEIEKFKSTQWTNFLETLGKSPLSTIPFWKRINRIRNQKKSNSIADLVVNGELLDNDQKKADAFADRLENIFSDENSQNFDASNKEKIEKFISDKIIESMYPDKNAPPFSMKELHNALHNLNNKTSHDSEKISNKLLKQMPVELHEKVLIMFNKCLDSFEVPDSWKTSVINMISKKSDNASDIKNYRPISITPCFARLY